MNKIESARLLITGSRTWEDYNTIARQISIAISNLQGKGFTSFVIVHGNCKTGADAMANEFCNITENSFRARGIDLKTETHYAEWNKHGKAAGPIRNSKMVDLGANICLAFIKDKSKGATGCAAAAELSGIETLRFRS